MANGFVVAEIDLEANRPLNFWGGNLLLEDLQAAVVYTNRADARLVLGQLQSSYSEREFTLLPAGQQIVLFAPASEPTPNPVALISPNPKT